MPKLIAPDGRIVSVSRTGLEPLRQRGYTDLIADTPAPEPAVSPADERPAQNAPKAAWVEYATAHGVEDADSFTKADLIDELS